MNPITPPYWMAGKRKRRKKGREVKLWGDKMIAALSTPSSHLTALFFLILSISKIVAPWHKWPPQWLKYFGSNSLRWNRSYKNVNCRESKHQNIISHIFFTCSDTGLPTHHQHITGWVWIHHRGLSELTNPLYWEHPLCELRNGCHGDLGPFDHPSLYCQERWDRTCYLDDSTVEVCEIEPWYGVRCNASSFPSSMETAEVGMSVCTKNTSAWKFRNVSGHFTHVAQYCPKG